MNPICSFLHIIATLFTTQVVSEKQSTSNLQHLYKNGWNHYCNYIKKERKGWNWKEMWSDCINLYIICSNCICSGLLSSDHTHTILPSCCAALLTAFSPSALFHSCCYWLHTSSSSSSSQPSLGTFSSSIAILTVVTRVWCPSGDLMTITSLQHFSKSSNPCRFSCPRHNDVDLPSLGISNIW